MQGNCGKILAEFLIRIDVEVADGERDARNLCVRHGVCSRLDGDLACYDRRSTVHDLLYSNRRAAP